MNGNSIPNDPVTRIRVADVGDGLCARVQPEVFTAIQVDCGSQSGGARAARAWLRLDNEVDNAWGIRTRPSSLFVSHYHSDHYNGILWGAHDPNSGLEFTRIDSVFCPGIPALPSGHDGMRFARAYLALSTAVAGRDSGHMEADLLRALGRRRHASSPLRFRRLYAGDELLVAGTPVRVLWPPRQLQDSETTARMRTAIEMFDEAKRRHKPLRALEEAVVSAPLFRAATQVDADELDDVGADDTEMLLTPTWPDGIELPPG